MKTINLDELSEVEYNKVMDAIAMQGFKLFVFGFLTFGIYPIIWHLLHDKE